MCSTQLFELFYECNSPDLFANDGDICNDRIIAAIVRAEPCVGRVIATDPVLQSCQQDFLSVIQVYRAQLAIYSYIFDYMTEVNNY